MVVKTDSRMIDVDKVSFIHETNRMAIIDGQGVNLDTDEDFEAVSKAFKWQHSGHTYDKNMKEIKQGGK